ncbi:MAG: caspase family protein [Hyphomicrobiaceae bacterium]
MISQRLWPSFLITLVFIILPFLAHAKDKCDAQDVDSNAAIKACTSAIDRLDRRNRTRWHYKQKRAILYRKIKQFENAISDCKEVLQADARRIDKAWCHTTTGFALRDLSRDAEAKNHIDAALRLEPDNGNFILNSAHFNVKENPQKAIEHVNKALKVNLTLKGKQVAYWNRAMAYFNLNKYRSAAWDLSKYLDLTPNNAAALYWRGLAYYEDNELNKSLSDIDLYLTLKPEDGSGVSLRKKLQAKMKAANSQKSNPSNVALVIGNSNYLTAGQLRNPSNDARRFSSLLESIGFRVFLGLDLNKSEMENIIRSFARSLSSGKLGLMFYAGHGIQLDGKNYLVPVDAKLETASDVDFELISLSLVQRSMESAVRTNVIFLDACRNNPLARNLARSMGTRSVQIGRGLAAIESGAGTLISYSTQPGNVALDGDGENSPFATALINHFGASGLSLQDILIKVRRDVMQSTDNRQIPWEHSALTERIVFSQ